MMNSNTNVKLVVVGLMLGLLLSSLDQTIVSTAMPTIIRDLQGLSQYSWVAAIYMLTSTTSMPLFGKLADLYGRRLFYVLGMGIFIIGSALCGLASNMTELIVFRGIQGVGAGALMPLAMTIIADIYPPDQRGRMQGIFGAVFGLSSILGPMLGGFIVEHWQWKWIFYINLPFGIAAIVIMWLALKETKSTEKRSIDWLGAVTLSGAIILLLLGLEYGGNPENPGIHFAWDSPQIIGMFAGSAALLVLFTWIESKVKEPIVPLQLFRNRIVTVSSAVGFLMSMGMFGAITYIPLYVQGVIGVKPSVAGYILTPLMLSLIAASIVAGRILTKLSYRAIMGMSMFIMALGFVMMSQMGVDTSKLYVVLSMIVVGLGIGPLMPTLNIAVQSSVDAKVRGLATSFVPFFRTIGATIGISIMGSILTKRMTTELASLHEKLPDVPPDQLKQFANPQLLLDLDARAKIAPDILQQLQAVFSDAVDRVFFAGLLFVVLGLIACFFIGKARMTSGGKKREEGAGKEASIPRPEPEMI